MRLFFLSAGLGALGLTALLLVAMGTYRPEMTTLMQHVKTLKQPGLEMAKSPRDRTMVLAKPTEYKVVSKERTKLALASKKAPITLPLSLAPKKSPLKANLKGASKGEDGQQLRMTFAGETPLGDDDFDAAGAPLDIPACTPDASLPKAILYDDCGTWPRWYWKYEPQCYYSWWGWYYGCWRQEYQPLQMPDGGEHELPQGFYSTLGDTCYDDRPIFVVKDRTKNEAAWMGGCNLAGCIPPHSCSAISLPAQVNIALFSEPNFMGNTISIQGPTDIPCLVEWGWNDRIQSVKVQNSIGLDVGDGPPKPVDRIHDSNWIYPGGPDSSESKYNVYFNQWDELDSSPHQWACVAGYKPGENEDDPCQVDDEVQPDGTKKWISDGDGVDVVNPEPWQADVNNLY